MTGRRKTPVAIPALRGSGRPKTRVEPPAAWPDGIRCPKWLTSEGRKTWGQLVARLGPMGILSRADSDVLARYCCLWARWMQADQADEVDKALRISKQLLRIEGTFGLTDADRANLARGGEASRARTYAAAYFRANLPRGGKPDAKNPLPACQTGREPSA